MTQEQAVDFIEEQMWNFVQPPTSETDVVMFSLSVNADGKVYRWSRRPKYNDIRGEWVGFAYDKTLVGEISFSELPPNIDVRLLARQVGTISTAL